MVIDYTLTPPPDDDDVTGVRGAADVHILGLLFIPKMRWKPAIICLVLIFFNKQGKKKIHKFVVIKKRNKLLKSKLKTAPAFLSLFASTRNGETWHCAKHRRETNK